MRRLSDGRQRRSREQWREIVAQFEGSGLSENGFCKKAGLNRKTFRVWRQRIGEEKPHRPAFVELAMPKPVEEPLLGTLEHGTFELQLPGGVSLRWRA